MGFLLSAVNFIWQVGWKSAAPVLYLYREAVEDYILITGKVRSVMKSTLPAWFLDLLRSDFIQAIQGWLDHNKGLIAVAIILFFAMYEYHKIYKHSRPKIKYVGYKSQMAGALNHTQIFFANCPRFSRADSLARKVAAQIRVFKRHKHWPLWGWTYRPHFQMTGRWAGIPGPRDARQLGLDPFTSEQRDIPPNRNPVPLDIAVKDPNSRYAYGYDNTNERFADHFNTEYVIEPGIYKLSITLHGENMDSETFRFLMVNPRSYFMGEEYRVQLESLSFGRFLAKIWRYFFPAKSEWAPPAKGHWEQGAYVFDNPHFIGSMDIPPVTAAPPTQWPLVKHYVYRPPEFPPWSKLKLRFEIIHFSGAEGISIREKPTDEMPVPKFAATGEVHGVILNEDKEVFCEFHQAQPNEKRIVARIRVLRAVIPEHLRPPISALTNSPLEQ